MNSNKSDTLEQRKKAQRDFLELKKMQAGNIIAEPNAEPEPPKTFSEKIKNFWYHYKARTILCIFAAIALSICVAQCAVKTNYDASVVLYTNDFYSNSQLSLLTDYITEFFSDTNGDNKINVQIIDCSYSTDSTYDSDYVNSHATKLQATIVSEPEVQLFIVDNAKLTELNSISSTVGEFIIDAVPMPNDFYSLKTQEGYTFPKNLIIGRRALKGTIMENNEKAVAYQAAASQVLNKIKAK